MRDALAGSQVKRGKVSWSFLLCVFDLSGFLLISDSWVLTGNRTTEIKTALG